MTTDLVEELIGQGDSDWPVKGGAGSGYHAPHYEMPGVTIAGRDIDNGDVAPDHVTEVGKAFMLDEQKTNAGHGDWMAIIGIDDLEKSLRAMQEKNKRKAPKPWTW